MRLHRTLQNMQNVLSQKAGTKINDKNVPAGSIGALDIILCCEVFVLAAPLRVQKTGKKTYFS